MDPGSVLLLVLLGILVVGAAAAITAAILLYKALRRFLERPLPGTVTVRRSVLKVRATAGRAGTRQLAGLRLDLQDALAATFRSLHVAHETRQHTGRLDSIVRTLNDAAAVVDRQLSVAQKDPNPAVRGVYAQTLGVQVGQIVSTATGVREALAGTSAPMTVVGLPGLTQRLEVEAQMLRNWSATYNRLSYPDSFADPQYREGAA